MYCINCGATVDEDSVFCTNCGKRIKADPVVTVEEQETAQTAEAVTAAEAPVEATQAEPVQPVNSYAPPVSEPVVPPMAPPVYGAPMMPAVPEKQQPEKVYFGKGALAFCLVVIALLAISTGVFAGLYFAAV